MKKQDAVLTVDGYQMNEVQFAPRHTTQNTTGAAAHCMFKKLNVFRLSRQAGFVTVLTFLTTIAILAPSDLAFAAPAESGNLPAGMLPLPAGSAPGSSTKEPNA